MFLHLNLKKISTFLAVTVCGARFNIGRQGSIMILLLIIMDLRRKPINHFIILSHLYDNIIIARR